MTITQSDIKLLASQRMTDTPDGGGRMTGNVLQSGVDNNVFDDVAALDRIYGNVSMRKVFAGVLTNDTDKYLGARVLIDTPADDENVQGLLFSASAPFDTRTEATVKVESYLAPGGFYQGRLYGNHLQGMSVVMLIQQPTAAIPTVGQVLLLRKNEGLANEFDQYVRVTGVASVEQVFTDQSGDFVRRVITCDISDPLRESFNGFQAQRSDTNLDFTGLTRVFDTVVADAAQYFGIRPLELAAAPGDFSIKADTVFSTLLPSSQIETPIADARSNGVSAAMVATGDLVTRGFVGWFGVGQSLFLGAGVTPGTLAILINFAALTITDIGGKLMLGSEQVGAIDYENGICTFSVEVLTSNYFTVLYKPGSRPDFISKSVGVPITINNRSLSYVLTLSAVPALGSLSVSYLADGRWYVLRDDGSGAISGSDSSLGAGNLNYVTGTVVVTVGALPDVGSAIVLQWAEQVFAPPANAVPLLNGGRLYFSINSDGDLVDSPGSKAFAPNTVTITWNDGSARSAADNGSGGLTGDATGVVDYVKGVINISPNTMPSLGTVFSVSNSTAAVAASAAPVNLFGGTVGVAIKPFTVSFPMLITITHSATGVAVSNTNTDKTVQVVDDGAGNLMFGDGANGNVTCGTVNYATGTINVLGTIALGGGDLEGAVITQSQGPTYQSYF